MIQITIIKIAGYGPWTLTLGSDREHEIQMLQAALYLQIQKLFSEKNGLVNSNRSDVFFAITNSITLEDHIEIQKKLESSFDLKLSIKYQKPVSLGISGPGMSERQAFGRIRPVSERAVEAIFKTAEELKKIK